MSFQNTFNTQLHVQPLNNYLSGRTDDMMQCFAAEQNTQQFLDLLSNPTNGTDFAWPHEENFLEYPMVFDNSLQAEPAMVCGNPPTSNEILSTTGDQFFMTEPAIETQPTNEQKCDHEQNSILQTFESRLEKLEERLASIEEQTTYITGVHAYIEKFQAWSIEFMQRAETLAREMKASTRATTL